jgi:hypothetical protein
VCTDAAVAALSLGANARERLMLRSSDEVPLDGAKGQLGKKTDNRVEV